MTLGVYTKPQKPAFPIIATEPAVTAQAAGATSLTAAGMLSAIVTQTPTASVNVALDTAANVIAALASGATNVGDAFTFSYINAAPATYTITVTSTTTVGNMVVAANSTGNFKVVVTAIGGSPAYTVYRL